MFYESLAEVIGNTPLVRLHTVALGVKARVYAKLEYFNPGNSVKDRIALKMVQDAEREGKLKPGGTIIEATSGNTGIGLAIIGAIKGYRCIFTISDKQSSEKVDALRAFGAEVIVCPTNVAPEDPRSYYSVAKRLSREIPNSYHPNQYDNPSNQWAHYETTGPELWEQSDGKLTHFVCGMGTCGTMTGISRYLKEKNPKIQAIGIDTYGSVFQKYKETGKFDEAEIYPYLIEGIGEDILPENSDFGLVDQVEKVTDKDAFLMARELARREGILVGGSSGAAVVGALRIAKKLKKDDIVVALLPDHGSRYLGKIFNDTWMKAHGFVEETHTTLQELLNKKKKTRRLISVSPEELLSKAIEIMNEHNISQLPVIERGEVVGSLIDSNILSAVLKKPTCQSDPVRTVMDEPFPFVNPSLKIDELVKKLSRERPAVMVQKEGGGFEIITRYDLVLLFSG
ncbi:MAG: cystathionine beta-synthase [Deltaproteobacteria bacterium RIFCSPLOWO2_02_FULL_44_10]|nr:MAG: cystathionine beta-synthase [Deltaproteobacteria bacterium RIFCSPHIGHO2_02_FULL_44_16]OGQ47402.1 MAG: cystathionine beta-synthase [Deltaproteobacteria bacterium RIFCSPLOWO2_02_FULL_44_10]